MDLTHSSWFTYPEQLVVFRWDITRNWDKMLVMEVERKELDARDLWRTLIRERR